VEIELPVLVIKAAGMDDQLIPWLVGPVEPLGKHGIWFESMNNGIRPEHADGINALASVGADVEVYLARWRRWQHVQGLEICFEGQAKQLPYPALHPAFCFEQSREMDLKGAYSILDAHNRPW